MATNNNRMPFIKVFDNILLWGFPEWGVRYLYVKTIKN